MYDSSMTITGYTVGRVLSHLRLLNRSGRGKRMLYSDKGMGVVTPGARLLIILAHFNISLNGSESKAYEMLDTEPCRIKLKRHATLFPPLPHPREYMYL